MFIYEGRQPGSTGGSRHYCAWSWKDTKNIGRSLTYDERNPDISLFSSLKAGREGFLSKSYLVNQEKFYHKSKLREYLRDISQ